jgi:membrane protein YqaA with SNARE-associated domain
MASVIALFFAAFLAASIFPAQSETFLVTLLLADNHPVWVLFTAATVGNVLGSVLNWLIGRFLKQFSDRRWFPVSPQKFEKAAGWYHRWGYWSLLASWVPIIGDPLTLVAGALREPFWRFALIVTLAKGGRYLVLILATLSLI